ncbi:MAG: hypothetical protein ACC662_10095, partial [Planctomycetota bacterium]
RSDDGRLLVTDHENHAMPLVPYAIGDLGSIDEAPCACGDPRPVLAALEGRVNDMIVLPSGARVPGLHLDQRTYSVAVGLLDVQFVQTDLHHLEVRYVPASNFRPGDLEGLREHIDDHLGHELELTLRRVDRIEPEPNGKVRPVISHVRDAAESES